MVRRHKSGIGEVDVLNKFVIGRVMNPAYFYGKSAFILNQIIDSC